MEEEEEEEEEAEEAAEWGAAVRWAARRFAEVSAVLPCVELY